MSSNKKKLVFGAVIIAVIALVISVASAILFPNAKITFSGITMISNGSTTQGFIDVKLKNIDTTGVSFCLKYDSNYIALSNVSDNQEIENPSNGGAATPSFNVDHAYFEQNQEAFPGDCFLNVPAISSATPGMPIIGVADADKGYLVMNFLPKSLSVHLTPYLDMVDSDTGLQPAIMANSSAGVQLGRISFLIKDPAAFSKLTPAQLDDVIKIVPFSEMTGIEDENNNTGAAISYVNEDGNVSFYPNADSHIDYEIDIEAVLKDVKPQVQEVTISAYEIYQDGTENDLIDYLNREMSMMTLYYTDMTEVPAIFDWTGAHVDTTWDPKGGTYIISKAYNDTINVEVTVNVTPITLTDYTVDNENITYLYENIDFPTTFEELTLAKKAHPVLSPYIQNVGIGDLDIDWYSLEGGNSSINTLPNGFNSGNAGTFTFIGHLSPGVDNLLKSAYPWLTVSSDAEIRMVRNVVTNISDMPKALTVVSAVTDNNGVMTITVRNDDGTPIVAGTEFKIRLPGGEILDTTALSQYNVVTSGNDAVITIDADIDADDYQKQVAQIINLGERAGTFMIASAEPGKVLGGYTEFNSNPRQNTYLDLEYTFDYSSSLSAMMPIQAGTTLPKTVTLPVASDRITTTYDGYYGSEPGKLKTFTVDGWNVTDGDITVAGSVVTIEGILSNTSYTNYGQVVNTLNSKVIIKYLVVENTGDDTIDIIPDFIFDTQQVGYGYDDLQTHTFTINNIGTTDIYGLSATVSLSNTSNKEAFLITNNPIQILSKNGSTTFDITTKLGLPVGEYISTVQILSYDNVLQTFNVKFEVSEEPVYKIKITTSDSLFGTAKTQTETYTAFAEDTVTIVATPEDDCKFVGWVVVNGDGVVLADNTSMTTTFTMPETDVEIKAEFEETLGAKLRLSELYVKDTNDNDQSLYDVDWNSVTFEPVVREYYVAVPNDTESAKLWFKLRQEAEDATVKITHTHDNAVDNITEIDSTDDYRKTNEFALDISPIDNKIIIDITYDDPTDDPDEGEVSRQYTIHIYRKLKKSELADFVVGNSPYGLIMKDDVIADKDMAKQKFIDDGYKFTDVVPNGAVANKEYTLKAWNGTNYDLDEFAIFVDNSDVFIDTGYKSIKNSIGETVTSVTKKVDVNVLAETNPSAQNGLVGDFLNIETKTITIPDSGDITQLKDERIRPDVYQLTYTFTDFDGTSMSLSKPLVVISSLGDCNISQTVDKNDSSMILNRFSEKLSDNTTVVDYDVGGRLYKYRVCDTNNDGNINAIDANYIRNNSLIQFYGNIKGGDA